MKKIIALITTIVLLVSVLPTSAYAAEVNRVDVQYYICPADSYETDVTSNLESFIDYTMGPLQRPLVLVLPDDHPEMYITLLTSVGYGFTLDTTGAVNTDVITALISLISTALATGSSGAISDPSIKTAKFYVSFYDKEENLLWFETDAIPRDNSSNGHREFKCGTDVKYITVYSWYELGAGEVFKASPYPSRVSYENARPVE
jgi:hypothetical protein